MTKSELKGMKVDERREELLKIFEDEDNEFPEMIGDQLDAFIDENWAEIEAYYEEVGDDEPEASDEESEGSGEGEGSDEDDEDPEPESSEGEVSEASSESRGPDPKKDLRYGRRSPTPPGPRNKRDR